MAFFKLAKTITKSFFKKPETLMYPAKPAKQYKISKGHVVNDIDKCIFCGSCQRVCPTQAICVEKNDRTWEIDRMRCCTCNGCVEVCPVKCLAMDTKYTAPMTKRSKDMFKSTKPLPAKPAPKKTEAAKEENTDD
jgi:formate hydrogenlyase subunit 6/NADH:ubiquinone oxidoreductase subunit I